MLYKKSEEKGVLWGVWRIDESIEQLQAMLDNYQISETNEKRAKERLAVRVLLKKLLGKEVLVSYKDTGKPFLANSYHISISHTHNYVAVSLCKDRDTGIDIEKISDKIHRIKSRFITDSEYINTDNETLHLLLHWSAKEAAYKIVDKGRICLKNDFVVNKFEPSTSGFFSISESKTKRLFEVYYEIDDQFVITVI